MALMMSSLSIAFANIGGKSAIIKFLASAPQEKKEEVGNLIITLRIIAVLVVGVFLCLFVHFIDQIWHGGTLAVSAWILIPFVLMEIVYDSAMAIMAGFGMFGRCGFFQSLRGILNCSISSSLLLYGLGVNGLVGGILLSNILTSAGIISSLPIKFKVVWNRREVIAIVRFSVPLYIAYMLSIMSGRAAEAMIVSFIGAASLAIYGNAMRFPNLLLRVFEAVRPVVLNFFSSDEEYGKSLLPLRLSAIGICIIACVLIVFSRPLILLIFSRKYTASIGLTRLLSLWMVFSILNYVLVLQLTGTNRTTKVMWLNACQFVLIITGHLILIPRYGALGAAISVTIGASVTVLISLLFLSEAQNSKLLRKSLYYVAKPVIPLGIVFFLTQHTEPDFALGIVYMISYLVVISAIRIVNLREIKFVASVLVRFH